MVASSEQPDREVYLEGLAVRGKYIWSLAIVTDIEGLRGANR